MLITQSAPIEDQSSEGGHEVGLPLDATGARDIVDTLPFVVVHAHACVMSDETTDHQKG